MTHKIALGAAFLALAAGPALAQKPAVYDSPVKYDGVEKSSLYVRSFDGVRLAVSVYRPTSGGKAATERLPVIVTQSRGDERGMRFFTDRGYVWVAADRRGVGASFGRQTGFVNPRDAQDGKAVIEWAASQPFTTGKAVAYGCSNQGVWQYRAAALAPKGLVAIAPACASPQFFDDAVVMNGAPIFGLGEKAFDGSCPPPVPGARQSGGTPTATAPVDEDKDGSLLKQAQADRPCNAPMLGQFWLSMPRDGLNAFDNYRPAIEDNTVTYAADVKRSGVAVLSLGGWYDAAIRGQFAAQAYWGGRVIMGPWAHGNAPPPGSAFPDGRLDLNPEMLRWYDHYAKGVANGADKPGVLYYTVGAPAGREWRLADRWRWGGESKATYYFGQDALSRTAPAGEAAPIAYAGRDVKWFDGAYQPLRHWWAGDMAKADAESLSQTSAPLSADTEVTGTPVARLWVSADTPDFNVFAVVEDVAPDGRSTYVTDGQLRASWRKLHPSPWGVAEQHWHRGFAADLAPVKPGEPVELVFDLYPTSYVFKTGHRVRVSLVTSIGQAYQAPPLAGGKTPTLSLHRSKTRPSGVELPVVGAR